MKDIISKYSLLCLLPMFAFCSTTLAAQPKASQAKAAHKKSHHKSARHHHHEECCPCPERTSYWTPYIGAEVHMLNIRWPGNFGGNILDDEYPEGGVFLGFKFCDYVAIEGGYEVTKTKVVQSSIPADGLAYGIALTNPPEFWYSKSQIKDWHADLLGFLPIYDPWCLELLASIGVQRTKITNFTYEIADRLAPLNPYASMSHFSQSKTVMRAALGFQQKWSECYGGRATVGWANTSKFHQIRSQETGNSIMQVKDSIRYGLGVFAEF